MRKIIVLAGTLIYFFAAVGSVFAQSASLTATVQINPLEVEVAAQNIVTVGEWFEIKADISNLGEETVSKTTVLINTPSELRTRGRRKRIGNLAPGVTEAVIWEAMANRPGNFVIQVEATSELGGEKISASDSINISATGSLGAFFIRLIFGV